MITAVDVVIIGIVLILTSLSSFKGLINQLSSFSAMILGVYLGSRYYYMLYVFFDLKIGNEMVRQLTGFLAVFLAVYLLVLLAGALLKNGVKKVDLNWVDHLSGAVLGLLKAMALLLIIIIIGIRLPFFNFSKLLADSFIAPRLVLYSKHLFGIFF